jgi:uncharacterized protein (DUF1330 family)
MLNIEGLERLDPNQPVVMLNLMRFHARSRDGDGSGWDAYLRYSAITVPMIRARGGTLLWTGEAKTVALGPHDGNNWDFVALVYYPSVAAFLDMMTSEAYETQADPHRVNGCAEHVIIATSEAYSKVQDKIACALSYPPLEGEGRSRERGGVISPLGQRVRGETATPPRLPFRFAQCESTLPLQGRVKRTAVRSDNLRLRRLLP